MRLTLKPGLSPSELRANLETYGPVMHFYNFSELLYTGYFKYHVRSQKYAFEESDQEFQDVRRIYNSVMDAQWLWRVDKIKEIIGDYENKSILDIACATGIYSMHAAISGFKNVLGVEIRNEQVQQAKTIIDCCTELSDLSNLSIRHLPESADSTYFTECLGGKRFDIVFSFGLLYHLSNPIQHMANVYNLTNEVALFQTETHSNPFARNCLDYNYENSEWLTKAVSGVSLTPHYSIVPVLLSNVGSKRVDILTHPLTRPIHNLKGQINSHPMQFAGEINLEDFQKSSFDGREWVRQIEQKYVSKEWFDAMSTYNNPEYFYYIAYK